jgi:peroxiredoxin family protein
VPAPALDARENRLSMLVFSGSFDKIIAAFLLASTAAASGMQVEMHFAFWGLTALRDAKKKAKKTLFEKLFGWMLPRGIHRLPMSQMNMAGMGPVMIRALMKRKRFASLEEMIGVCAEFGVEICVCEMSRELMGIKPDELFDYPHLRFCGAADFIDKASRSRATLFI